ncbi:hypothetical protein [Streptomyces sp. NBC_01373]|uniref:hypothetical protein n=1 Tax=Streptomyces sp. NBC_01373 TaxID=2903843 RepID=UPI002258D242|nr:hypothetical protein [Streptomyces sp. NBC_01373]MCX4704367.1 hypothetical protein [Streptomyces sp. NBC_01373]MCX4707107.1 hypothetical protein [Streptomyces sp. NBC_01373]
MPDAPTTRLGLYKSLSDGSEDVDYSQDIGQNLDKLDAAAGFQIVTSSTRPSSPYPGKPIAESDTSYRTYFSNGTAPASASWVEIPNSSGTFGSTLKLASGAQLTIGADVNLFRNAANVLRTNDGLIVDGALTASGNLAVSGNLTVTGIGQTQYIAKTADETITSSTTFQDDDHLVLPVVASAVYTFALDLYTIDVADFIGDFKITFTCPTGATFDMHGAGPHSTDFTGGTNANGEWIGRLGATSASTNLVFGCGSALTAVRIYGRLVMSSTAGNFRLQWAQNASDASGVTVKAGSIMTMTRVA